MESNLASNALLDRAKLSRLVEKIRLITYQTTESRVAVNKVLFVNNSPRRCGVYEFGKTIWNAISPSKKLNYCYREFSEQTLVDDFLYCVKSIQPNVIVFNWHPVTMPWLNDDVLYAIHRYSPQTRMASIVHDVPAPFEWIDGNLYCDPTHVAGDRDFVLGRCISPRPIPDFDPGLVIGSFGFGLGGKGFQRVVQQVNAEFDKATIRLHVPYSDYCDPDGSVARQLIDECVALAKPGISVVASSNYLSNEDLLTWLAGNAVNCFFYDEQRGPGISSVIDLALTARRPIAITPSTMFRHVVGASPSIVIGQSSLRSIIANGLAPLENYYQSWNQFEFSNGFDLAMESIKNQPAVDMTPNRVLSNRDRQRLRPVIEDLTALCPDIMSRKFPQAVFQNAFIFEQARRLAKTGDRIILIGGYEDPIGPSLQQLGFDVTITDPFIDGRSSDDVLVDSIRDSKVYDLVISCSVIEHVEQDFDFVKAIYELLAPGGTALLTTDYRDGWNPSIRKPSSDVRLYTSERLRMLAAILPPEAFANACDWQPVPPYFHCDDSDYGFCSLTFRRPESDQWQAYGPRCLVKRLDTVVAERNELECQIAELRRQVDELTVLPVAASMEPAESIIAVSPPAISTSFTESLLKQTRKIRSRKLENFARKIRQQMGLRKKTA
jgi:SAM-dependent methyltransferase